MAATKQPQDRKPPKGAPFTFHGLDGKKYTLPPVVKAKLKGADLMDGALDGEAGQVTYMFKKLKAAGSPEAIEALRVMDEDAMMDIIKAWGEHGDGDGASLGE